MSLYKSVELIDISNFSRIELYLYDKFKTEQPLNIALKEFKNKKKELFNVFLDMVKRGKIKPFTKSVNILNPIYNQRNDKSISSEEIEYNEKIIKKENVVVGSLNQEKPVTIYTDEIPNPKENYNDLYKKAMGCYIKRDYIKAIDLLEKCREINQNDSRVVYNLTKLNERL